MDLRELLIYRLHEDDKINQFIYENLMSRYHQASDELKKNWVSIIQANSTEGYEDYFFEEDLQEFHDDFADIDIYAKDFLCMIDIYDYMEQYDTRTGKGVNTTDYVLSNMEVRLILIVDEIARKTGLDSGKVLKDFLCSETGRLLSDEGTESWRNDSSYFAEQYMKEKSLQDRKARRNLHKNRVREPRKLDG